MLTPYRGGLTTEQEQNKTLQKMFELAEVLHKWQLLYVVCLSMVLSSSSATYVTLQLKVHTSSLCCISDEYTGEYCSYIWLQLWN